MEKKIFLLSLLIILSYYMYAEPLGDVNGYGQIDIVDALVVATSKYYNGFGGKNVRENPYNDMENFFMKKVNNSIVHCVGNWVNFILLVFGEAPDKSMIGFTTTANWT